MKPAGRFQTDMGRMAFDVASFERSPIQSLMLSVPDERIQRICIIAHPDKLPRE